MAAPWVDSSSRFSVLLRRQRLASIPRLLPTSSLRIGLIHHHGQDRIGTQFIVVVQILIAQAQSVHPLPHQLFDAVFHKSWIR